MEELYKAKQDFLTNCYTREAIGPYLTKLLAEYKAYNKEFCILLLDIDHFKPFNDKYGHLSGDELLKYFSSSLRLGLSQVESNIFRFGGDEFIVVLPDKLVKEAAKIASGLQHTLKSRPFLLGDKLLKMSFSGGIASCVTDGDSPDNLIANADKAMYLSKKRGRGRTTVCGSILLERVRMVGIFFIAIPIIAFIALLSFIYLKNGLPKELPSFRSVDPFKRSGMRGAASSKAVSVRLKSGAIIRGRIIKEGPDSIELGLSLDKGEGSVSIKRSNILSIKDE